jgi:hypothetical protein
MQAHKDIPVTATNSTLPESTDALIAGLAAEAVQEADQERGMLKKLARVMGKEKAAARAAYEKFLDGNWRASGGQEERLRSSLKRIGLEKILKLYDKIATDGASAARRLADHEAKNAERIRAIMAEIDNGRADLVKNNPDGSGATLAAGNDAVADALKAGIQGQAAIEQIQDIGQTLSHARLQAALDGQKAAIQQQLTALKKAKLFGKFMPLVKIMIQAAVMALFSLTGVGAAVGTVAQKVTAKLADTVVGKIITAMINELVNRGVAAAQNPQGDVALKGVPQPPNGAQHQKNLQGQASQADNAARVADIIRQIGRDNGSSARTQQAVRTTNDRLEQALNGK